MVLEKNTRKMFYEDRDNDFIIWPEIGTYQSSESTECSFSIGHMQYWLGFRVRGLELGLGLVPLSLSNSFACSSTFWYKVLGEDKGDYFIEKNPRVMFLLG